ncbi:MAG TPA: serine/threonine-protein kinase [Stellaceae bacterium]|nr:serine/threonine-protein kinase [Stellaceae bacterium]
MAQPLAGEGAAADSDGTRIAARAPPPPTRPPNPEPGDAATSAATDWGIRIGEILSHTYRIDAFLAMGGMGAVFRARHVILDTEHAIKIIRSELADNPRIVELLSQEAKALSKVKSDAVVEYQGLFLDERGRRYLVMEYVDGPSLARWLSECRLTTGEIRRLRDRLAAGLAAVHDKGVFHRDLSPDNVLLPGGRIDQAKIIDFGIAKHSGAGEKTVIDGDFAGKLSYASPEQLGMNGGTIDARSDIYGLGLVLASCAIGYGGKLAMGDSPTAAYQARQTDPNLDRIPEELRGELAAMLRPKPEDRLQSMRAIIEGDPADDRSAPARRRSSRDRAPRRGGRRALAALAGVVALLALSALAHALYPEFLLRRFGSDLPLIHANLQRDFAALSCSYLETSVTQDRLFRLHVAVDGVVGSKADAQRVVSAAGLGGRAEVSAPLEVLPWPLCEGASLARAISEGADPADRPRLSANRPDFIFHDGDPLMLKVAQSRRFAGFLYVDYLDPSGEVLHLLPAPPQPDNAAAAGAEIAIGLAPGETAPNGQILKITPPFGTQLILAISTRQPLFAAPRPRTEPAGAYLAALRQALDDAGPGADAAAAYRLMQTLPKT